jgi:hypothetical protein
VSTLTAQNTGTSNIRNIDMGGNLFSMQSGYSDTYVDDVSVEDAAYPSDGRCIARQGKSGAPTNNAWTKSSGADAYALWSDTPFSAASNCKSTTNTAQTMLVADVGAGVDAVGASDTINACRVMGVAKFDSTSSALSFYRMRRRVSAANTDEDVTGSVTSTTDAFVQGSIFTATRSELQAAEIGGVVGTGGGTRKQLQFEDLWMMVDYTPAAGGNPWLHYAQQMGA